MVWWRSRYVQHLEAENAELREQIKRMLNPQWRYLLYGETISESEIPKRPNQEDTSRQNVKIPRYSWRDFAAKAEYMVSPQYLIDKRHAEREEHIHSVTERIS